MFANWISYNWNGDNAEKRISFLIDKLEPFMTCDRALFNSTSACSALPKIGLGMKSFEHKIQTQTE